MIGVCFSRKVSLGLWDESGVLEIEKSRIAQLMDVNDSDLILLNASFASSTFNLECLKKLSRLYAPGPYSLLAAIFLKLYFRIIIRRNLPIYIRFGYMPDILHFKNGLYWNALKAEVLILLALIFCKKLYVIHNFRNHLMLRFHWKVEWIEQKIARETIHPSLLSTENREFDFLFCGRLEKEKGADAFLSMDFGLSSINVVGDGSYSDRFKERFPDNYYNSMTQSELATIYSKTKYLINLSPSEGSPKVVLEALLNGCVVIALSNSFIKFDGFENQILFFKTADQIKHFIETGTYLRKSSFANKVQLNDNNRKILIDRYTI